MVPIGPGVSEEMIKMSFLTKVLQILKLFSGVDQELETCLEHYLLTNVSEILEKSLPTHVLTYLKLFFFLPGALLL